MKFPDLRLVNSLVVRLEFSILILMMIVYLLICKCGLI